MIQRIYINFNRKFSDLQNDCKNELYALFESKGITKVEIPYDEEDANHNLEVSVFNDFGGTDNKVVSAVVFTKIFTIDGKTMCNLSFETTDGYKHSLLETNGETIFYLYNAVYNQIYQ